MQGVLVTLIALADVLDDGVVLLTALTLVSTVGCAAICGTSGVDMGIFGIHV